jgi:hypothetical protein
MKRHGEDTESEMHVAKVARRDEDEDSPYEWVFGIQDMVGEVLSHLNSASIYSLGMVDKTMRQRVGPWFERVPLCNLIRSAVEHDQAHLMVEVLGPRFFALSPSNQSVIAGYIHRSTKERHGYWKDLVSRSTADMVTFRGQLHRQAIMTDGDIPLYSVWCALLSTGDASKYPLVYTALGVWRLRQPDVRSLNLLLRGHDLPPDVLNMTKLLEDVLSRVPDEAMEFVIADMQPALLRLSDLKENLTTWLWFLVRRPTHLGLALFQDVHQPRVRSLNADLVSGLLAQSYDQGVAAHVREYFWETTLPWLLRVADPAGVRTHIKWFEDRESNGAALHATSVLSRLRAMVVTRT